MCRFDCEIMSDACLMAFVLFCLFFIFSVKHETRSLTENSIDRGEDDKTMRCLKRMKEEKINLESGRVCLSEKHCRIPGK